MTGCGEEELGALECMPAEALDTGGPRLASGNHIAGVISPQAVGKPGCRRWPGRLSQHYESVVCWLLRRMIPRHLAEKPPPDREIYY